MQKDTPPPAPRQGLIRLTPKQRQLLLSTPFAQRVLRLYRLKMGKPLEPEDFHKHPEKYPGFVLRQKYYERRGLEPPKYYGRISEQTIEEGLIRVQILIAEKARRLRAKIDFVGMATALRKLATGKLDKTTS